MTSLAEVLASFLPAGDGRWRGALPSDWLQGRTAYGGLSTAVALHCASQLAPNLPPLRSAQVAFVGPLAGSVGVAAQVLRRGRNATFVAADVSGAMGLGLRCTFVFMAPVASTVDHRAGAIEGLAPPAPDAAIGRGFPAIAFTQRFETAELPGGADAGPAEWRRWVRLVDRTGIAPMTELVAIADSLPPGALRLMPRPAPVSSVTWLLNVLDPAPATEDGWWLLRTRADHAKGGGSSQVMEVRNARGLRVAEQMQSVALFG